MMHPVCKSADGFWGPLPLPTCNPVRRRRLSMRVENVEEEHDEKLEDDDGEEEAQVWVSRLDARGRFLTAVREIDRKGRFLQ